MNTILCRTQIYAIYKLENLVGSRKSLLVNDLRGWGRPRVVSPW